MKSEKFATAKIETTMKEKVLQAMREFGAPVNAGKIAEITGIDRKEVDKALPILFEEFGSHPFRYSFGLMPLRREKNLLNEGVSAKWRRSAIWVMLSWEVCNRKEASIRSI